MDFYMSTPFYTILTKTPQDCRFLTGPGHVSSRQDYELLNPWATMLNWCMIILFWGMLDAIKASESQKKKKRRARVTGMMMLFNLFADALVFSVCFENIFYWFHILLSKIYVKYSCFCNYCCGKLANFYLKASVVFRIQ